MISLAIAFCSSPSHNFVSRKKGRLVSTCPRMAQQKGDIGDGPGGEEEEQHIPFSRLGEFAYTGGNRAIQDDLAQTLMWRVAEVSVEKKLNENIRQFDQAMSDILSALYFRREQDIIAQNESIALRAAFADIALWNNAWREGQRTSRERRKKISEELAIINRLLRSQNKSRKKNVSLGSAKSIYPITVFPTGKESMKASPGLEQKPFGCMPRLGVLVFITAVPASFIAAFEHVVQEKDPSVLAKFGFLSIISIAFVVHVQSIQRLHNQRDIH